MEAGNSTSDRRRLLEKLLRECLRSEIDALEAGPREAKRIGESPPVEALREIARHAEAMQPRLRHALEAHELEIHRGGISSTLTSLRHFVADRFQDPERAYRGALLELRHGVEVVRVLRELSRLEELFGVIRWCDDWLSVRRTLVSRVEAQLCWFVEDHVKAAIDSSAAPNDPDDHDPLRSPASRDWL